jgi:hypothetical protein
MPKLINTFDAPLLTESREPLLSGEQYLHGALFEESFFGDELLKAFNESIRLAQALSNGFLFSLAGSRRPPNPPVSPQPPSVCNPSSLP